MADDNKKEKKITIVVNGEPKVVTKKETLTFVEVLDLAFPAPRPIPDAEYSITYKGAKSEPHKGSLHPGGSVEVKEGTSFDVTPTKQS